MSRFLLPPRSILVLVTAVWVAGAGRAVQGQGRLVSDEAGTARAVVVGISQYAGFPEKSLKYADRDAAAFRQFLVTNDAWAVEEENARLLLNGEATSSNIFYWLEWLRENSRPGDRAVIYFAGHGDVETSFFKRAYLLAADSPGYDYRSCCTIGVHDLQDYAEGMAAQGIEVLVVTDACRAGNLVGNVEGAHLAASLLSDQWQNVVKFASSEANQLSHEGSQWGGGHGVFTYHLIRGLEGEAADSAGQVRVDDLEDYLVFQVSRATDRAQRPQRWGDGTRIVSRIEAGVVVASALDLDDVEITSTPDTPVDDLGTATRNVTDPVAEFHRAVAAGNLLDSNGTSAFEILERIRRSGGTAMVVDLQSRLAFALFDQANQVVLDYLAGGNNQPSSARLLAAEQRVTRTADLLGPGHLLLERSNAMRLFLRGYGAVRGERFEAAVGPLEEVVSLDPEGAYGFNALGFAYLGLGRMDEATTAFTRAAELAPRWSYPSHGLGLVSAAMGRTEEAEARFRAAISADPEFVEARKDLAELFVRQERPEDAERLYLEAIALDPTVGANYQELGGLRVDQGNYQEALPLLQRALLLDSTLRDAYLDLGVAFYYLDRRPEALVVWQTGNATVGDDPTFYRAMGIVYELRDDFDLAIGAYARSFALAPTWALVAGDLGDAYRKAGRHEDAVAAYQQSIGLSPTSADAYAGLGRSFDALDRPAEAERAYRQSAALDSLNWERFNRLGVFYELAGRYDEAENAYRRSVSLDSTHALVFSNLGDTYRKTRRYAEGIVAYRRAIALDPAYAAPHTGLGIIYRSQDEFELAEGEFVAALAIDPDNGYAYNALGVLYENAERYADAATNYDRASQYLSDEPEVFNNLGDARRMNREYEAAHAAYSRAAELEPGSGWAFRGLALNAEAQEDFEAAEAYYVQAIQVEPAEYWTYHLLGSMYWDAERLTEAEAMYRRARELNPASAVAADGLGEVLDDQERADEAEQQFLDAVRLDSLDHSRPNRLGIFYENQRRYGEAEQAYLHAYRLDPTAPYVSRNLGDVYWNQGRLDEAEEAFLRAITLEPDNYAWPDRLGVFYELNGRLDEALASYLRAAELDPEQPGVYRNLGDVYRALQRFDDAEAAYRRAMALAPGVAQYPRLLASMLWQQNKVLGAVMAWQQVLAIDSTDLSVLNSLAWAMYGAGSLMEAAGYSDRSLDGELDAADRMSALDTRANIYLDQGDQENGLRVFDEAMVLASANELGTDILHFGRAMCLLELGRNEEAATAYRAALSVNPSMNDVEYLRDVNRFSAAAVARVARLDALIR